MSQTISRGQVGYRTAAMDPHAARAFARCLAANQTRFTNVEMLRSKTARTEKYFILFQPISSARRGAIRQDQQEARADRALEQPFLFWQDPDVRRVAWCYSVESRETYPVTAVDCECADFRFRCKRAGLHCKHMIARRMWLASERAAMIAQDF